MGRRLGFMMLILIIFLVFFFVQLAFLVRNYFKMVLHVWSDKAYKHDGISIVIACKNDEDRLQKNLPFIFEQKHTSFEIIIVDDASDIPLNIEGRDKVKVIRLDESKGKRFALEVGVKAAQYNYVLFTDADCKPASKFWAGEMLSNVEENTDIVLGFGGYKSKKGLLGNLVQLDTLYTVASYMSAAIRNKAYMGVGRNILFRKLAFEKALQEVANLKNQYGDDDILVQKLAKANNIALCMHPRGFTWSSAPESMVEWFKQKKRHVSAGHFYKKSTLIELGLERFSLWCFYATSLILVFTEYRFIVLFALLIYWLYKTYIFDKLSERYESSLQVILFPVWDLFYSFCLFIFTITSIFAPTNKWR